MSVSKRLLVCRFSSTPASFDVIIAFFVVTTTSSSPSSTTTTYVAHPRSLGSNKGFPKSAGLTADGTGIVRLEHFVVITSSSSSSWSSSSSSSSSPSIASFIPTSPEAVESQEPHAIQDPQRLPLRGTSGFGFFAIEARQYFSVVGPRGKACMLPGVSQHPPQNEGTKCHTTSEGSGQPILVSRIGIRTVNCSCPSYQHKKLAFVGWSRKEGRRNGSSSSSQEGMTTGLHALSPSSTPLIVRASFVRLRL